jgi:HSP90 family molecular chaperone
VQPNQKFIYNVAAANRKAAESRSSSKVSQRRKCEVLFIRDPADDFVIAHVQSLQRHGLVTWKRGIC